MATRYGIGGFRGICSGMTPTLIDFDKFSTEFGVSSSTIEQRLQLHEDSCKYWQTALKLIDEEDFPTATGFVKESLLVMTPEYAPLFTSDSCFAWISYYATNRLTLTEEELHLLYAASNFKEVEKPQLWEFESEPVFPYIIDVEVLHDNGKPTPPWSEGVRSVRYMNDYVRAAHIFRYAARPGHKKPSAPRTLDEGINWVKQIACWEDSNTADNPGPPVRIISDEDLLREYDEQRNELICRKPAATMATRLREARLKEEELKVLKAELLLKAKEDPAPSQQPQSAVERMQRIAERNTGRNLFVKNMSHKEATKARFSGKATRKLGLSETTPFPTIDEAVKACKPYDTIVLLEGVYSSISIKSLPRGITIRGVGIGTDVLIDANSIYGTAITISSAEYLAISCVRVCFE